MLTAFIVILAIVVFVWLLVPNQKPGSAGGNQEEWLDPNDSRQLGVLMGIAGGSITDAAVMRFAIQRFQEIHGRRASMRDVATVLGIARSQSLE